RGGAAALREFPLCIPFVCSVSPLYFPKKIIDAVEVIAAAGLPLDALSNPVMGLTAPYTLAGTVVVGHAEVLALAVMAHAVTPGLPILAQNTPSVADMRSLASTTGGPETGLIRQTAAALDQSVGIPACAHGHTSSARLDYQSADEKALNTLLIASARPALLGGLGALANVTATAYEALVLDNERYGAILRMLEGVQTDTEHLGLEVIAALSRGESALTHNHTLRYLRSAEVWRPRLALRQGLVGGAPPSETSLERARAEVSRLLAAHTVEALPEAVMMQMEEVLREYDRGCGERGA
ncbi:MAG: trimethylamine methyltransferase family protein, partial [Anaerolineae bacterium]|nr:trimethylamine methyltransferase family protein [Anaerolineae bacterium]